MAEAFKSKVDSLWSEKDLNNVLNPTGNVVISDRKIQRDAIMAELPDDLNSNSDIRKTIQSVVSWDNYDVAISLWSGNIQKAEQLMSVDKNYESPDAIVAAIIERFAQPPYYYRDWKKTKLSNVLLPILQSSPVIQAHPSWKEMDREKKMKTIQEVIDDYVEDNPLQENDPFVGRDPRDPVDIFE